MSIIVTRVYTKLDNKEEFDKADHVLSIIANQNTAIYLGEKNDKDIKIYQNSFDEKISKLANDLIPNSSQNWTDLALLFLKELVKKEIFFDTLVLDIDIKTASELEQQIFDKNKNLDYNTINESQVDQEKNLLIIAELTNDIKKIQADYINYKKRVEKNSELILQNITTELVLSLIPLMDDIYRIENINSDPIVKSIKLHLESILRKYNVKVYTEENIIFDPNKHEALLVIENNNFQEPTVTKVLEPGYMLIDKVIKAAKVEVTQQPK